MTESPEAAPAVTLTRMAMGSDVPEWLLAAEPRSPGAFLDRVRFAQDVLLLELPDVYLLEPVTPSDHLLFDTGRSNDCLFVATGKPVRVPTGIFTFTTKEQVAGVTQFKDGRLGGPPAPDFHQAEAQRQAALEWELRRREAERIPGQVLHPWQFGPVHTVVDHTVQRPGLFRRWWLALFG